MLRKAGQHRRRPLQQPHRLAAPEDGLHFARMQIGDIGFDRGAGRLGPFTGCHAGEERVGRRRRVRGADGYRRLDQELATIM
jgi:hypothetical protein